MASLRNRQTLLLVTLIALLLILAGLIFATAAQGQNGNSYDLIKKYWPGDDAAALRVAECESGYDERARRRGSQFTGVFQIGVDIHQERIEKLGYDEADMYDAGKNTRVAYDLWQDEGWVPWSCQP